MRLLLALGPLVVFYVVESRWGLREAVVAAMAFAAVELAYTRWVEGRWSRLTVFTAAMVGVLGGLSLYSDDPRFVLLSPVVGDLVFAAILAGTLVGGMNLVVMALQEQDPTVDLHPLELRWFDGLVWRFSALLVVHAALTWWAAGEPRETWLFVSGPLQYVMILAQIGGEVVYSRLVVHPRIDAEAFEEET